MDNLNFSIQNIIDAQGIGLAITGMSIVFTVLAFIALFIGLLPKLLALLEPYLPEEPSHGGPPAPANGQNDPELVAAIAYLLWTRKTGRSQPKQS